MPARPNEAQQFWEAQYQKRERRWTGQPDAILKQFAESLIPGTALDLGCSEGNSAVWLAGLGGQVTGVDISGTALERAAEHAKDAGVSERTHFESHDLSRSFPAGSFDLVYALYLESPVYLPRAQMIRRTAETVADPGTEPVGEPRNGVTPSEAVTTLSVFITSCALASLSGVPISRP